MTLFLDAYEKQAKRARVSEAHATTGLLISVNLAATTHVAHGRTVRKVQEVQEVRKVVSRANFFNSLYFSIFRIFRHFLALHLGSPSAVGVRPHLLPRADSLV